MDHTRNSFTHSAEKSRKEVSVGWMTPFLRKGGREGEREGSRKGGGGTGRD